MIQHAYEHIYTHAPTRPTTTAPRLPATGHETGHEDSDDDTPSASLPDALKAPPDRLERHLCDRALGFATVTRFGFHDCYAFLGLHPWLSDRDMWRCVAAAEEAHSRYLCDVPAGEVAEWLRPQGRGKGRSRSGKHGGGPTRRQ